MDVGGKFRSGLYDATTGPSARWEGDEKFARPAAQRMANKVSIMESTVEIILAEAWYMY